MKRIISVAFVVLSVVSAFAVSALNTEIKVLASTAVKDVLGDLIPQFEKASGHIVKTSFGGTADIKKRIMDGEAADIIVLPVPDIEELIRQGRIERGGRIDFVRSTIGVAISPGSPWLDISSSDTLKKALLSSKSILLPGGPGSGYLRGLFRKMGIADALEPKIKVLAPGLLVSEALARGEGEIGFAQASELRDAKGFSYVGSLPPDIQSAIVISIGIHTNTASKEPAGQLMKFLTAKEAAPTICHRGFEPANQPLGASMNMQLQPLKK